METVISNPQSAIRNPQSNIFLVGFMACGKSTVGPVLATKLNRPFIDLDRLIEAKTGCAIAELIARNGEEQFRRIETEMLRASAQSDPAVIAPGGGAITRAENREQMLKFGIMVWLDAPFELCWQRIKQDGVVRPLAPDEDTARVRYEQRVPLYRMSNISLAVGKEQSPDDIAKQILTHIGETAGRP